eukprot:scaffold6685_cov202-Prasinococcus_capsulatus_cf.AAC.10
MVPCVLAAPGRHRVAAGALSDRGGPWRVTRRAAQLLRKGRGGRTAPRTLPTGTKSDKNDLRWPVLSIRCDNGVRDRKQSFASGPGQDGRGCSEHKFYPFRPWWKPSRPPSGRAQCFRYPAPSFPTSVGTIVPFD